MTSLPVKLMVSIGVLALIQADAASADAAKARKHRKHAVAPIASAYSGYRGLNLFPAGPIYHACDYLGDDPDPFIRSQILRDLGAHYGGDN